MGCPKALRKQGYKWNRKTKACEKKEGTASSGFKRGKQILKIKI